MQVGVPASPAFVFERGVGWEGGGGGWRREERVPAGAAGLARGEAHKKRRQGGKWVRRCGGRLPMVAYDSRAPTSTAPSFSLRACA
jgi:hypothetical protein